MICPRLLRFIGALLLCAPALNALPVFPAAAGFGSHTVAGRGGKVYRVTNLNDSGPGSLREGVQFTAGPRVIVFEVSGVIELQSDLVVPHAAIGDYGRLTVAGQTAPPPGITLKNAGISVRNSDVLIQHLAIRPGTSEAFPDLPGVGNRDAIEVEAPPGEAVRNVVIDHVSCSWALDETVSTWSDHGSVQDVTFSNSVFSHAIRRIDGGTPAGYGASGGRNTVSVSFIGNLMAFNRSRNPLIRDTITMAEVVNNFIYRPSHHETAGIYFGSANPEFPNLTLIASVAGNVILRHPASLRDGEEHGVSTMGIFVHDRVSTEMSIYLANNSVFNPDTGVWHPTDGDAWSEEIYRVGAIDPRRWTSNPFPFTGSKPWTDAPAVIEERVLARAGKQPAFRDAIDERLIEQIRTRTGTWLERMEELGDDPWQPADGRQTRALELPPAPNDDDDNDGYTNLEEWLHGWSAWVEGTADRPPGGAAGEVAATNYQTRGVVDNLPVFYGRLKERVEYPLSWTSGAYSDFNDWKTLARERVRASFLKAPPNAPWNAVMLGEEDRGSYVARKLAFNVTGDSRVLAYITVPKGKGPFPTVLLLHDHGGRYDIGKEKVVRPFGVPEAMEAVADTWTKRLYGGRYLADELSKRGYVCFVTDALNWGDRAGGGFQGQDAIASNLMHLGMSFAGLIAWEDLRAVEFLVEQAEVDTSRIAAMGLSMGAYRAWQVAAMSDQIAVGVAICWMSDVQSMIYPGANQTKGSSAFSMLHPGLLADLDYPDVASIAAPKPMLFFNGLYDRLFPQPGVKAAYAKMRGVWESQGAADRLHTRIWSVEHVFDVPMQEAAFEWLDTWLGKRAGAAENAAR